MMEFSNQGAEIFVPDGAPEQAALERTTHMAIVAHHDDLEILAVHGILECYQQPERWFLGVVAADGRGAPRTGPYADLSDDDLRRLRRREQRAAATIGEYGALVMLDHSSAQIKDPALTVTAHEIADLVATARPETIYCHGLTDSHDTHVALALRTIAALRTLPSQHMPKRFLGCEVWRDLDWLTTTDKVVLDVSGHEALQSTLLETFDSQVSGGKRYDLATIGRRHANATFQQSHQTDATSLATNAMDLMPLLNDPNLDPSKFAHQLVDRLSKDVANRIHRLR